MVAWVCGSEGVEGVGEGGNPGIFLVRVGGVAARCWGREEGEAGEHVQ